MIYIADNILNYFIYLSIGSFGFRKHPRKHKICIGASVFIMLFAGAFNAYFDMNSPVVYMLWSVLSIGLFFEGHPVSLTLFAAWLMYFTGIIDSFSVTLLQVILIGGGITDTDITWWMESAYFLSFFVYVLVYVRLLKKNEVYLCDIEWKYKLALLVQGSIFEMFYNFVFVFFNENGARYGWNAYLTFLVSIVGVIYSIFLTLSLAIKNILFCRQNRELALFAQMQKQQYDYQLRQTETIRRFRHDFINHIGALRELLHQKKLEDAKAYVEAIWDTGDTFDYKIHTGDDFLDVIINYYFYLAKKEQMEFSVSGKLAGNIPVEMIDLTSLMGNVLQNAWEAALQAVAEGSGTKEGDAEGSGAKEKTPRICIEFSEHKKEIFIVVRNSVAGNYSITKNGKSITGTRGNDLFATSKKEKENHGFGLKNIAAVVEKYHGEFDFGMAVEHGGTMFQIRIAIPKKEED